MNLVRCIHSFTINLPPSFKRERHLTPPTSGTKWKGCKGRSRERGWRRSEFWVRKGRAGRRLGHDAIRHRRGQRLRGTLARCVRSHRSCTDTEERRQLHSLVEGRIALTQALAWGAEVHPLEMCPGCPQLKHFCWVVQSRLKCPTPPQVYCIPAWSVRFSKSRAGRDSRRSWRVRRTVLQGLRILLRSRPVAAAAAVRLSKEMRVSKPLEK